MYHFDMIRRPRRRPRDYRTPLLILLVFVLSMATNAKLLQLL